MKTTTFALLLAMGSPLVFAQSLVPTKLSYQGRVSDSSGTLIGATSAVNRTVYFKLYTTSTGGTPVWAESQTVTISAGEFSVLIGNGTGISTFVGPSAPATTFKTLAEIINTASNTPLYLGVTVDDGNSNTTDVEISPRQQFVSGAFALRAAVAESVASSGITASMIASGVVGTDALGTSAVTTAKVATSAITADKIGDAAVTVTKLGASSVTSAKIDTTTVGLWTPYVVSGTSSVYRPSGNVGIGIATPSVPLHFAPSTGDKISLFGAGTSVYGFGIQGSLLQVYSGGSGADIAFGYGSSNSFTEKVRIKGSGFVGIGTSSPGFPLDFSESLGDKISLYGSSGTHFGFGIQAGVLQIHTAADTQDVVFGYGSSGSLTETVRIKGSGSLTFSSVLGNKICLWGGVGGSHYGLGIQGSQLQLYTDSSSADIVFGYGSSGNFNEKVRIKGNGCVGIGTNSPESLLHVNGGQFLSYASIGRFNTDGATGNNNTENNVVSITASGAVRGGVFHVVSDKRIKKDFVRSDMGADLKTLLGIQVTDYKYIDALLNGTRSQKKVVAQQLAEVFPQAVNKGRGFIPDIFQGGTIKDGWVLLEKEPTNPLKIGDKIRLIEDKADDVCTVVEVAVGKFRMSSEKEDGKVFVYGREVNDFHSVDYDAIAMLTVSATQELHRQLEVERSQTAALRRKLSELESSLGARLEALEKASKTTK